MAQERSEGKKEKSLQRGTIWFLVRIWGSIAALCMILTGVFVLVTIHGECLIAGIVQIAVGAFVLAMEAPIFCVYFTPVKKCSDWVDSSIKHWLRGTLYVALSLPPFFLCRELSTFLGGGALLVTAVFYILLSMKTRGKSDDSKETSPKHEKEEDLEMTQKLLTAYGDANELNTY